MGSLSCSLEICHVEENHPRHRDRGREHRVERFHEQRRPVLVEHARPVLVEPAAGIDIHLPL
jgi:hypothetical protein